jgi:hypothetical protein
MRAALVPSGFRIGGDTARLRIARIVKEGRVLTRFL